MHFFTFNLIFNFFIGLMTCQLIKPYDYYLFQLTLPTSFCGHNVCEGRIPHHFVIHGNWPNRFDRKLVINCEIEPQDLSVLDSISDQLIRYWPALKRGDHSNFWFYQWKKHGSCATETSALIGPKNFFSTTLEMFKRLNLDENLRTLGYFPSSTQPYETGKFYEVMKMHFGVAPYIRCQRGRGGVSFLENISFCFDKELNLIDCPQNLQCGVEFLFLAPKL